MKSYLFLLLFLLCGAASCKFTSPTEDNSNVSTTKTGGCYHIGTKEWDEYLDISIKDGKLSATGTRSHKRLSDRLDLSISGKQQADGSFNVGIHSISSRTKNKELNYENWIFDDKKLTIQNRSISDFTGDLNFYKINCINASEKDEKLYDAFLGFFEGYAVVMRNDKYGLVNKNWDLVIACKYRYLGPVNEGTLIYYGDELEREGILDVEGNIILKPIFSEVTGFSEGLCGVLDNGKWGFVNKKGEVVIPPQYFMINYDQFVPSETAFNEGLANVAIADTEWGYINPKGEIVIPYQYKFAGAFKNGRARVMRKNEVRWIYIDKTGKCVEGCE